MPATAIPKPVVLCILDGWGHREETANNAVALARTPTFDTLWQSCPHALLKTDGLAVGLPEGQMGNSEVGHMTIGTGRVLLQDLPRIDKAIADGLDTLDTMQALIARLRDAQAQQGRAPTVHMLGLISTGGVHSHQDHAAAFANTIARAGFPVALHLFLDGRDRPPQEALREVQAFQKKLDHDLPIRFASLIGRYFAMDRDKRWDRVGIAYDLIVDGTADQILDLSEHLRTHYAKDISDEFMPGAVLGSYAGAEDGDALLCINFRADRVRQILSALVLPEFDGFKRKRAVKWSVAAGLTQYSTTLEPVLLTLFPPQKIENDLGTWLAAHGKSQLRIAETEKYAHVTYFFNAGQETPLVGEDRIVIPSPKVATYDLQPAMSAVQLTDTLTHVIETNAPDLIVVNFANPDMVGHSGKLDAAKQAVEAVDTCLSRLRAAVAAQGGALIVTADHGNVEEMWDAGANAAHTQHTLNRVPVILDGGPANATLRDGTLADLAPTLLDLLDLQAPPEMTGRSLLRA